MASSSPSPIPASGDAFPFAAQFPSQPALDLLATVPTPPGFVHPATPMVSSFGPSSTGYGSLSHLSSSMWSPDSAGTDLQLFRDHHNGKIVHGTWSMFERSERNANTRHEEIMVALHKILATRANHGPEPLKRSDYPNVPYWTREDWTSRPDKSQAGKTRTHVDSDMPVKTTEMTFLTDAEGVVISAGMQHEVRHAARRVFETIEKDHQRDPAANAAAPASWDGGATLVQRNLLCQELEAKFDFMRLCANGWKSNQVGIKIYPQWIQKHARAAKQGADVLLPPAKKARLAGPATLSELATSVVSSANPFDTIDWSTRPSLPAETPLDEQESTSTTATATETPISAAQLPVASRTETVDSPHAENDTDDQIPTEILNNTVLGDACGEQPTARNVEGASIPTQVIDTSTSAPEKPKRGEYTQRGMCRKDWEKAHPAGTEEEFSTFWKAVSPADKKKYATMGRHAKLAAEKARNVANTA